MKKVLFVVPHLSTGGLPQYTLKLIESIKDSCKIYCIEYQDITGGILTVQRNKIVNRLGNNFYSLTHNQKTIHEIIYEINPDVIHFQEIPQTFIPLEDLNEIYSKYREYKIVVTTHGSHTNPKEIIYTADKFILVSNWSKNIFVEEFGKDLCDVWEYPIEKIKYNKEDAKKELGFDSKFKHILNVGLFTPGKNQGELIELARKLKDKPIKFHFVGNQAGNFEDYWKPLMKDFPDNCIWHGEREDVDKFYKASDVFYFTSNLELNPLVVKEALSYGLPTFIKKLHTYENEYDGLVNYISENENKNIKMLLDSLDIEVNKPKIQAIHLLTNTTHKREIKSISQISQLQNYGIDYVQHINEPYDEIPPKEFCKRPDIVSKTPISFGNGYGSLTGRHYGCFLAHINAIKSISDDYDYTLIFEADASVETSIQEFVDIIYSACIISFYDDVYYISFSDNPSNDKIRINDNFSETPITQYLCHAYLIPNKCKNWYLDKIEKCPWDGYDLWLNDVFIEYPQKRYTTNKVYSNQIEGLSLIDNIEKWNNNSRYDYIEIGTSDFETLVEYMPEGKRGLSIDPIQTYLNRLPDKAGNEKIKMAISDKNYKTNFYYVSPEDIETHNLPEWIKGCNSIDEKHPNVDSFLKDKNLQHLIKSDEIECISFDELVKRFNINEIDMLKIDTEGNDIRIINNMLKTNVRPKKLYFEANSLYEENEILDVIRTLENNNYHLVHRDSNNVTMRLKDDFYIENKKPILIISAGRRNDYLKTTLNALIQKNPDILSKLKKVWLLDDRSDREERKSVDELMEKYFGDKYNTIHFNGNEKFDFVDKFNMIGKLVESDDIVLFLEDDWECKADLRLEYHVNRLINSDWTQIAFCDPLYAQVDEIKTNNCNDLDYWYNPYPNYFRHPVKWNGDMYTWFGGSINNWTNNPSLIKGSVFYNCSFDKVKNFEAEFANKLNGKQVFTNEELFRHFGENSLINQL